MPSPRSEFPQDESSFRRDAANGAQVVADFESSILSHDWEFATECANILVDEAKLLSQATQPLLRMFCSDDGDLHQQGGRVLFERPHWIDPSDLNELVIPCVIDQAVERPGDPMFEHALYGLSMVANRIEDSNTEMIFRLAKDVFYEQGSGKACIGNAALLAFGERVPTDQRSAVLQCVRFILKGMEKEIASGNSGDSVTDPDDFDCLAISALSEIRRFMDPRNSPREHRKLASDIVVACRDFVETFAQYAESGNPSSSYSNLLMLTLYPTVDPHTHIPTQQAIRAIADALLEESPRFSRLLYKSIGEDREAEETPDIPEENLVDVNTFRDLQLVSDLSRMAKMFKEEGINSVHVESEGTGESAISKYLANLSTRVRQRTVAMQVQRAQAALNDSSL